MIESAGGSHGSPAQRPSDATVKVGDTQGGSVEPEDRQAAADLLHRCPHVPPDHVQDFLREAARALMLHRTANRSDKAPTDRHRATLRRLVEWAMVGLHEEAACPFCELGHRDEDLGTADAKHDAGCLLAGYELTVDLQALLASTEKVDTEAPVPIEQAARAIEAMQLHLGESTAETRNRCAIIVRDHLAQRSDSAPSTSDRKESS